jgi:hypothetical protein
VILDYNTMIPPRDQLPRSWKGLKKYSFDFPLLSPNDRSRCPRTESDILKYLDVEAPGGSESGSENVIEFDLHFVRTALVNDCNYWLWRFKADGDLNCYVAVRETASGGSILGYEETLGLTPEQWIVMDYYDEEEWEE